MRRILTTILFICILMSIMTLTVTAGETSSEADYLNALGLLKGTENGYELNEVMNRLQGAVMIVRLLGDEQIALEQNLSHPFTDVPEWGDAYIGYMVHHGLTTGKSSTIFGSLEPMTEVQYVTFILRSLGYDDQKGDFYWADAMKKAYDIGLLKPSRLQTDSHFLRRDMAYVTYQSLKTPIKASTMTLEHYLLNKGTLPPTIELAQQIMTMEQLSYVSKPKTKTQLEKNLQKMVYELNTSRTFDVSFLGDLDLDALMTTVKEDISMLPMYSSILSKYQINRLGNQLTIKLTYNVTYTELEQAKAFARKVIGQMIEPDMTDYEKEMLIHDYIINRVTYDDTTSPDPAVYTIYGALIEKKAVCHGYAESFNYMSYLAGLKSCVVRGDAVSNGKIIGHAWNIIEIDGETYHVDTTWDDPISESGKEVLTYNYFNLDDVTMDLDHNWTAKSTPKCDDLSYNYYVYNKMVVYGITQLKTYLQNAFDDGDAMISVKVVGEPLTSTSVKSVIQSCTGFGKVSYRINTTNNILSIENNL